MLKRYLVILVFGYWQLHNEPLSRFSFLFFCYLPKIRPKIADSLKVIINLRNETPLSHMHITNALKLNLKIYCKLTLAEIANNNTRF